MYSIFFSFSFISEYSCFTILCPFLLHRKVNEPCCCSLITKSCPIFQDPMDCSLPGSSVHRIFWTRTSDWVAIAFSKSSSWPKDQTHIPCIGTWILYHWAAKEALESAMLTHTPLRFRFPSHFGHLSVLSGVPCGIQYILMTYLFYTWKECIMKRMNRIYMKRV